MNAQLTSAWSGDNFWLPQLVIAMGLSFTFVGVVGGFIQQALETDALAKPINVLTYSASIHIVRLLGREIGTAAIQRLVSVREQYHSNLIGLQVDAGNWVTAERLRALTGGLMPGSPGLEDAQGRAALVLGGQIKAQAYTLACIDGFTAIALVAAIAVVLIALMKPMRIYFDSSSAAPPG